MEELTDAMATLFATVHYDAPVDPSAPVEDEVDDDVALADWVEDAHPRDEHGQFAIAVSTDGAGRGQVKTDGDHTSYAGVSDDGWTDWAYDSDMINAALDGKNIAGQMSSYGGEALTAEDAKGYAELAKSIDRAAATHVAVNPETHNTFYRGDSFKDVAAMKAAFAHHSEYTTTRLTSVTTDADVALDYARGQGMNDGLVHAVVELQNPNGVRGVQTAPLGVPSNEIVLARNQTFRVGKKYAPGTTPKNPSHWIIQVYSKEPQPPELPKVSTTRPSKHLREYDVYGVAFADWDESQHPRGEHGEFSGAPDVRSALDPMADYKPGRPLTGPDSRHIDELIPGATHVPYFGVPGVEAMQHAMGVPEAQRTMTPEYNTARKTFFASQPKAVVPFSKLVFTQPRINLKRAEELTHAPLAQLTAPLFMVKSGDKYYVMNGHHRVIANYLTGHRSLVGNVFTPPAQVAARDA